MHPKPAKAFTFIELMIVCAIIAILAAIAVPNFLEAQTRALVAHNYANLALVHQGLEAYRLEHRAYPAAAEDHDGRALNVLTTPVVFIARVPLDVFTTEQGRQVDTMPAPTNEPFRYLNALPAAPGEGLAVESHGLLANKGFAAGLVWGYGPASRLKPEAPPTRITAPARVEVLPYDPTNGTQSAGDMYRLFP